MGFCSAGEEADDIERLAARALEGGARIVVVTMGADGSVAYDGAEWMRVPAEPLPALVDTTGASWRERRTQVEAHEVAFTEAVRDLRLRGDLVEAVDRWVTPEFEKRRFDTWFLTALLPQGARAEAVSRESQRGRWVRPETMLDECASGAAQLLPPTRIALERLSRSADAAQALTQARACSFVPTHPRAVRGQNGLHLQAEVNL